MLIRPWQEQDIAKIEELERLCFSAPWSYEMLNSSFSLPNFLGFVAEEEGEIVGYIGSTYIFEDGEILLVAVEPNMRRRGFAESLLQKTAVELKQRGVYNLFLEVRKSNYSAINCYLKNGFDKLGERKRYYENGEDAIIMEKKL
ncbi:MAG: ribosomal-protein-alanine N-acetyltransferase [Clostridiales bacterium]|nr:ribosomal-protein-alanine N-acetyltransferase [Clostridiales bacterium]